MYRSINPSQNTNYTIIDNTYGVLYVHTLQIKGMKFNAGCSQSEQK